MARVVRIFPYQVTTVPDLMDLLEASGDPPAVDQQMRDIRNAGLDCSNCPFLGECNRDRNGVECLLAMQES